MKRVYFQFDNRGKFLTADEFERSIAKIMNKRNNSYLELEIRVAGIDDELLHEDRDNGTVDMTSYAGEYDISNEK